MYDICVYIYMIYFSPSLYAFDLKEGLPSHIHMGSVVKPGQREQSPRWPLAKNQAQNINRATSQDRGNQVTFRFDTKFALHCTKYLKIHSKGGPEVRPHPHAAVHIVF